jgi:predicted metal-binding protein
MEETLSTRGEHEKITRKIRACLEDNCQDVLALSTESCAICKDCTYPEAPCRHPDRMIPCIESYGILVTELAEKHEISFLNEGNVVTWFGLLLYQE